MEIEFLRVDDVLGMHEDQIERYGGSPELRDPGLLSSAVETPRATFGGRLLHETLFDMAAAYLFHIVQNHPFVDGNKRRCARRCAHVGSARPPRDFSAMPRGFDSPRLHFPDHRNRPEPSGNSRKRPEVPLVVFHAPRRWFRSVPGISAPFRCAWRCALLGSASAGAIAVLIPAARSNSSSGTALA
jgi:hypothetical protein